MQQLMQVDHKNKSVEQRFPTCSALQCESSRMMARANATRFLIPPESSLGYNFSTPLNPTDVRLSATSS